MWVSYAEDAAELRKKDVVGPPSSGMTWYSPSAGAEFRIRSCLHMLGSKASGCYIRFLSFSLLTY